MSEPLSVRSVTETYDLGLLRASREKWERSAGLRAVYGDLAGRIAAARVPGPSLEVGAGIGWLRDCLQDVVPTDLLPTPWVQRAASAYELEALGQSWANVIAIDVLHHLTEPLRFLRSAAQVLRPGGRLILVEPAATPLGRLFYGLCHHEPMAPGRLALPWVFAPDDADGRFANMGMATALFGRTGPPPLELAPLGLELAERNHFGLLAYPLTGGFSRHQLAPTFLFRCLLRWEAVLPDAVRRLTGLRVLIALEQRGPTQLHEASL